jgi:UDP-glucose 4-epimerase
MKEKILITGASGFLGFHLIEAAVEAGLDVYAAIRKTSSIQHLECFNIQYTYLNFESPRQLEKEIRDNGYNYVIHAAGVTKARTANECKKVNADYAFNIAKATEQVGAAVKRFVFISSLAAMGPLQKAGETITEYTTPEPITAYGKSKLLAEQWLLGMSLPLVILRPTAIYGPLEKDIFILLKAISRGWEPYIGNMPQQLSFVYVKDVARVTIAALFNGDNYAAYNISDGNCYPRDALANTMKEFLQRKTTKFYLPHGIVKAIAISLEKMYGLFNRMPALNREKLHELTAANWNCSIDRAKKELGFDPYDLATGLAETIKWYKQNKWL